MGSDASARRLLEVAAAFLRLGCVSFGGPIAHLGYLRTEFVEKRGWLDDAHYGDLVALCQFLPGPASSQVVFAIGMQRAGVVGALLASACFTLPSALAMLAFAQGVALLPEPVSWLHGLQLAAVAVVAQAVWGMGRKLCPDRFRQSLCWGVAAALLVAPGIVPTALAQLGVIALGGSLGWARYGSSDSVAAPPASPRSSAPTPATHGAVVALLIFVALLLVLPSWSAATGSRGAAIFSIFYRSGALVFGGGHVVLPLLRAELVPAGFVSDAQFLAGYGAAQALPGPLFAFAAYLGAVMNEGAASWLLGAWCLFAIFLPAWLLVGGALPFWQRLRARKWAQAILAGTNAAVVGVLLAALYDPLIRESVGGARDVVTVLLAFSALEQWKAPPWLVVAACAAAAGGIR